MQATQRMLHTLMWALTMIHLTACIYHWISHWQTLGGGNSWVSAMNLNDSTWAERYYASLYWTIATLTTTGYGDSVPISRVEKLVAMVAMFLGLTSFSYIITAMSRAMDMLNADVLQHISSQQVCCLPQRFCVFFFRCANADPI